MVYSELLGNSNDIATSDFTFPLSTVSMIAILVANDIAERLALQQPRGDRPAKKTLLRCATYVKTGCSSRDCRVGLVLWFRTKRKFAVAVYAQCGVKLYTF